MRIFDAFVLGILIAGALIIVFLTLTIDNNYIRIEALETAQAEMTGETK